jgi:hypothetical protein
MRGLKMRRALPLICLLACLTPPTAKAAFDPLGSGTTKLTLDKAFITYLAKNEITLTAKQGAKKKGPTFTLPVSGGSFDSTIGKGEINQEGTLLFSGPKAKVPLRGITVKAKHSPLIAKVGGSQLKVASAAKLSSRRSGFGARLTAKPLKLSAKVATRLNKKLRPMEPFQAGQTLGTLISTPQPKAATVLESGRATLVFDPSFLTKLESRFVSLNPIFPAEHVGPTYTFPITAGGQIAPTGTEGTLRSGGAVELLQLGGGQVFWQELWLDLGAKSDTAEVDIEPTPAFPGKIGRVGVLGLSAGTLASDAKARSVSLTNGTLVLDAGAANTLNDAFNEGKELFRPGDVAGSLSFAALVQ